MALVTLGVQLDAGLDGVAGFDGDQAGGEGGDRSWRRSDSGRDGSVTDERPRFFSLAKGPKCCLWTRDLESGERDAVDDRERGWGGEGVRGRRHSRNRVSCGIGVDGCRTAYGRVDILHNNVGIGIGDAGPTHLTEENSWDRILNVNLKSVFLTCKHALPVMREQGSGAILNISSIAAVSAGSVWWRTRLRRPE